MENNKSIIKEAKLTYELGGMITLRELIMSDIDIREALEIDLMTGHSHVWCPDDDCNRGRLRIQESRSGWGDYVGCDSGECNFHTTFIKIRKARKSFQEQSHE